MKACRGQQRKERSKNLVPSPYFLSPLCQFILERRFAADLGFVTGNRLDGKLDVGGLQYRVLLQDVLLGLVVAERLAEEETKWIRGGDLTVKPSFPSFKLTFLPYRHWKNMIPTDQTSTLLEIFGGSLPTTKHSGGRYLARQTVR